MMDYYWKSHPVWRAVGIYLALHGSICLCQSAMMMQLAKFIIHAIFGYYFTLLVEYVVDVILDLVGNFFVGLMGAVDERRHRWQGLVLPGEEEPEVQVEQVRARDLRPRPKFPGRRPVTRSVSRAMAAARLRPAS